MSGVAILFARPGATAIVAAGALVTLCAQEPSAPQTATFRSRLDLVQVDVVALDAHGHPVHGLTAKDFTLLDRKKPQEIVAFEEVTHAERTAEAALAAKAPRPPVVLDVATNQVPADDRLVVMLLDDLHLFDQRSEKAKSIARKVVNALGDAASMSVLFTSGRHSLEFTRDKTLVLAAIDTLKGTAKVRKPTPGSDGGPSGGGAISQPDVVLMNKDSGVVTLPPQNWTAGGSDATQVQAFFDDQTMLKTMEDAARMLIGASARRKAFVLVSEGTMNDVQGFFDSSLTPCEIKRPRSPCFYQRSLQQTVKAMQRASVSLYAFDPRGQVKDEDLARECFGVRATDGCMGRFVEDPNNGIRHAQEAMRIESEGTGGFAVTNTDDYDTGVARLVEQIDDYYLLGFSPRDRSGTGFRPITMTVNRPGLTLHYREGYSLEGPPKGDKKADPLVAMSASVLPSADLPLRLTAAPLLAVPAQPGAAHATRIIAILEATVPRSAVTGADGRIHGELRYSVLAANLANGKVVQTRANSATFTSGAAATAGADPEVRIEMPVSLTVPPGHYQLRASAISATLGKGGSVYLNVDVPDLAADPIALSGILLTSARGRRVPVATGTAASTDLPFAPTLNRDFDHDDVLRAFCRVTTVSDVSAVRATVDLIDAGGQVAVSSQQELTGVGRVVDVTLPLGGLAPGAYTLRVRASDGAISVERVVGVVVK